MSEPAGSHHEEEALGKVYDVGLLRRLVAYVRPYGDMALGALGLIILSSLLQLIGPLATAVALDLFVRSPGTPMGQISAPSAYVRDLLLANGIYPADIAVPGLTAVSILYLAVLVLTFCALYAQGYVLQLMGQYIMKDMRGQIFGRLQRLPLNFYDRNPLGRLVTRVTTDVDALNEMFTAGIVSIFGDLMLLFGIVVVLFWLDWRLALVAFSIIPLLFWLTSWFRLRVRESFRDGAGQDRPHQRLPPGAHHRHAGGAALQRRGAGLRGVRPHQRRRTATPTSGRSSTTPIFFPGVELITALGVGLLIWVGGGRVVSGAISIGALIAFLQYAQRFYQPLSDLSEKYNVLQSAMASSERIFRLLDTPVTIASPPAAFEPEVVRGDLEFDDVRFAYKEGEPVLQGGLLPGAAGRDAGGGGAHRRRQEHPGQPPAPLLRHRRRRRAGRRGGRARVGPLPPAPQRRHGAPGRLPLLRHGRRQHPAGQRSDRRRADPLGGGRGARPALHRAPGRGASTPSSRSAAPGSRWGRSSSSPSPAPSPSIPAS